MTARGKAGLVVIALLALALLAMRRAGDVAYDPQAGIVENLPAKAGAWTGDVISYCTNRTCEKIWKASELAGGTTCTNCGGGLASMATIERQLLPADTRVERVGYATPGGRRLIVSTVFSGRERSSIHRPEVCLAGGGNSITDSRDIEVALPGRAPLKLTLLTLRQNYTTNSGERRSSDSFFAYWFVAKDHETASHTKRMMLMASDRIFHGVTHRWAYVSIAGALDSADADPGPELREFLAAFVPQLAPR